MDKIHINNDDERILFENRTKLLMAIERAHENEQELPMWVKNYETILNTKVEDREKVYSQFSKINNSSDSIKKEAVNIVIKKQLEMNRNKQQNTKQQNIKQQNTKQQEPPKKRNILRKLHGKKQEETPIKINLASDVLYERIDNKATLKKYKI